MKKYITVILSAVMLLSCLSGCSLTERTHSIISDLPIEADHSSLPAEKETDDTKQNNHAATKNNLLDSMTQAQRREVNIFLSNFSEAHYKTYPSNENEERIGFAYIHNLINNSNFDYIYYDGKMGIPSELVDSTLIRFFGESVPHETPPGSKYWTYENGNFVMPAASGESYAFFSVATTLFANGDGTFTADFNVYSDPENPHDDINPECYSFTDSQAAAVYDHYYSGRAVLKPKVYNNSDTYELVYYTTNQ